MVTRTLFLSLSFLVKNVKENIQENKVNAGITDLFFKNEIIAFKFKGCLKMDSHTHTKKRLIIRIRS